MRKAPCGSGAESNAGSVKGIIADSGPCPYASKSQFYRWLRRRRGAPRPDPEREWSEFDSLNAAARALTASNQYRHCLENPTLPNRPAQNTSPKRPDPKSYRARVHARMRRWGGGARQP